MIIAQTPRLTLRLLTVDDAAMILALLNEQAFIENIGDKQVRNLADARNYIIQGPLAMQQQLGFSLYCCERVEDGVTVGISGLIKRVGIAEPEVGFAFLACYCRQGYGYESAYAAIKHAKEQLDITHLQAICNPDNSASIGLLVRLGFDYLTDITLADNEKPVKLFDKSPL